MALPAHHTIGSDLMGICGTLQKTLNSRVIFERMDSLPWAWGTSSISSFSGIAMYNADFFCIVIYPWAILNANWNEEACPWKNGFSVGSTRALLAGGGDELWLDEEAARSESCGSDCESVLHMSSARSFKVVKTSLPNAALSYSGMNGVRETNMGSSKVVH